MKREDFKEILPVHFETCRAIINHYNNDTCSLQATYCHNCPFSEIYDNCRNKVISCSSSIHNEVKKNMQKSF